MIIDIYFCYNPALLTVVLSTIIISKPALSDRISDTNRGQCLRLIL